MALNHLIQRTRWVGVALSTLALGAAHLCDVTAPAAAQDYSDSSDGYSDSSYENCQYTGLTSSEVVTNPSFTEQLLRFRSAWLHSRGAGITVAVIDTGVAQHPRLGEVLDGGDVVDGTGAHFDCDAHGTFVAGLIAGRPGADAFVGVAPEAQLLSIRQTAADDGDLFGLATAIDTAVERGARVINISLTSCTPANVIPPGADDVTAAVHRAERAGVVIVAASGNQGSYCEQGHIAWPAVLPEVIATSAVEFSATGNDPDTATAALGQRDGTAEPVPAPYAITGDWVDISAPGGPIAGPNPRVLDPSKQTFFANAHTSRGGDARPIIGTSFAAPIVSGTVALLLAADPLLSPREVRHIIAQSARPISSVHGLGAGVVDPVAAVSWVTKSDDNHAPLQQAAMPEAHIAPDTSPNRRLWALSLVLVAAVIAKLLWNRGARP